MSDAADTSKPKMPSHPDEISDVELVARARSGRHDAFEELVRRHQQKVYGAAMNLVRNEQDALDLTQQVFVKAWRSLGGFEGKSAFSTWLYRITQNLGIDFIRKHRRHVQVEFDTVTVAGEQDAPLEARLADHRDPSAPLQGRELRDQVRAAMEKLSPEHRQVLILKAYEDMDYRQIAEVVGCSMGTVMSRLFYARQNLKKHLKGTL